MNDFSGLLLGGHCSRTTTMHTYTLNEITKTAKIPQFVEWLSNVGRDFSFFVAGMNDLNE